MGITDNIGKALIPAIDKVIEARYDAASAAAERLRRRHPQATPSELADLVITRYRKELTAVGVASGGVSAVPGVGTGAALATGGADVAWTVGRLSEMILAVASAYGHSADDVEERRAWVLAVLSVASGAASGVGGLASELGTKGGVRIVKAIPMSQIVRLNQALGGRIVVKWGTQQGAVRLGRLIPFGVGAGIGGAGNYVMVRSVGRSAKHFFDDGGSPVLVVNPVPVPSPDAVIDAEVVDDIVVERDDQ